MNTITLQKSQLIGAIDFVCSLMDALDVDDPTELNEWYNTHIVPLVTLAFGSSIGVADKCESLDWLKALIEKRFGSLDNDCGCYVNGQWLSVASVAKLIDEAEKGC